MKNKLLNILKVVTITLGCIFFLMLLMAFTPLPYYMHHSLGRDPNESDMIFEPDYIVMMGGGAMPSEDNLIRLYYTAEFSKYYHTPVIILHPDDSLCAHRMFDNLVCQGVDTADVMFSHKGRNTRAQVIGLRDDFPEMLNKNLLVITSPSHLTRSVKSFNKADFTSIRGVAAFNEPVDFDLSLNIADMDDDGLLVRNTKLRYTFWNYLATEINCLREYCAIAYYKVKNWI